jgi:hypothetical protein
VSIVLLGLAACGPRNFANENDRLREQVMDLETEVTSLRRANEELEAQLVVDTDDPAAAAAEIRANTPRAAAIDISPRSHLQRDETGDRVIVYVQPRDGRGRFVQLVGHLSVHVALVPTAADARTLGRVQLAPGALRDAYRSSFAGTHYTVEVPTETIDRAAEADVRVHFNDGWTGRELEGHRSVKLIPGTD